MTRKNSTVNPKAGTLKQQDRALRISLQSGFVKSFAFALLLSLTAPAVTQALGDQADTGKEANTRIDRSIPDSCCVADDRQNKGKYRIVRLTIPSTEMIRKSDSEATRNLVYSLRENKLSRMSAWISRSDREIDAQFSRETRISQGHDAVRADADMALYFQAENIPVSAGVAAGRSDDEMNNLFRLENEGILWSMNSNLRADDDISRQFVLENTRITLPSAADFAKSDAEMSVRQGSIQTVQTVASSY
jgi:hypothetical protein